MASVRGTFAEVWERFYHRVVAGVLENVATAFYRDVVIRGFESVVKRRRIFPYWGELERSQWLSRRVQEERQFLALQKLLAHAHANCPYFRETWDKKGLDPAPLRGVDAFRDWPVVHRETIREHRSSMRAVAPPMRISPKATGGSSGEPLHFDLDDDSHDRRMAAWLRGYNWAGAGPGTKQFYVWGAPVGAVPAWARWKLRMYNALYRRRVENSFELSDRTVPRFLARMRRYGPEVVVGYTNPLYSFARALREQGLRPPPVRSIVVGAEKLHDFQRETLEEIFEAPVFETYGSREFMMMAGECDRHQGLHTTFEHLLIEVVDDNGVPVPDGVEGDVLVTDLYNYGMPFIRYANGDRAIAGMGECGCGRGLPTLKGIVGRRLDIVTTPDGRRVPGEYFPHLLKEFSAIRRFQVVQNADDEVVVLLVLAPAVEIDLSRVRRLIADVLGPEARLDLQVVNDIPLSPTGKLKVVVNRAKRGDGGAAEQ